MTTATVLEMIDGAIEGSGSPDAMRWVPDGNRAEVRIPEFSAEDLEAVRVGMEAVSAHMRQAAAVAGVFLNELGTQLKDAIAAAMPFMEWHETAVAEARVRRAHMRMAYRQRQLARKRRAR